MDDHNPLLDRVSRWLNARYKIPLAKIAPKTALRWELGIDGDDAAEFFEDFAQEFGLSREGAIEFRNHFGDEGLPLSAGCWIVPMMLPGLIVAHFLGLTSAWVAVPLMLVSCFLCGLGVAKFKERFQVGQHRNDPTAIRVKHLVMAAASKTWSDAQLLC